MSIEMFGVVVFFSFFCLFIIWGFFHEGNNAPLIFFLAGLSFVTGMLFAIAHDNKYYVSDHEKCRQVNGQWVEGSATKSYCIYPKGA